MAIFPILPKLVVLGCLTVLCGCGADRTSEGSSRSQWGFGPYWRNSLVRFQHFSTINLCGAEKETVAWAIQTWAKAIGVSFRFAESCDPLVAHVFSYGTGDASQSEMCATKKDGGFARPERVPQEIVNCGAWNSGRRFLLHEVGHLFGLCDQYGGYDTKVEYCEKSGPVVSDSVMAAANREDLSDDDIAGIRAIDKAYWNR